MLNTTSLAKRAISFFLVLLMVFALIPALPKKAEAIEATPVDPTDAQVIGYGFNVTSGPLKKTTLRNTKPILNLNSDIYDHISVMDVTDSEVQNRIAFSFSEVSEIMSDYYDIGISGKIQMVTMDLGTAFGKSNAVKNAVQERYEIYCMNSLRRSITIQLDVHEIRDNYLADGFKAEILSIKNKDQAKSVLEKYGTHLITGYNMGGRLELTNYQTKASYETAWSDSFTLTEQMGAAVAAYGAGQSFSITQQYAQNYNTSTENSTYYCRIIGGGNFEALTIDHVFTYNPSLMDGKGGFIYGEWTDAINNGEKLEILGISEGGQSIPLWELIPKGASTYDIRNYLVEAYVEMCGDKYDEYNEMYSKFYSNVAEENSAPAGSAEIDGYIRVTNGVVTEIPLDDSQGESTIPPNTTVYMTQTLGNGCDPLDKSWIISDGNDYVEVLDAYNGVFKAKEKVGTFVAQLIVNGEAVDQHTFKIRNNTYTAGSGTESDPYILSKPEDFLALSKNSTDWASSFIVSNDIDMSKVTDASTWNVIGNSETPFSGTIEGNYSTIKNFNKTVTDAKDLGLFGVIGDSGSISNLTLENFTISISDTKVFTVNTTTSIGALAGTSSGKITNCIVKNSKIVVQYTHQTPSSLDKVTYQDVYAGSLVGYNKGSIESCGVINPSVYAYTNGDARGNYGLHVNSFVGGLVGRTDGGTFNMCYVKTVITGGELASSKLSSAVKGEKHSIQYNDDGSIRSYKSATTACVYTGGMIGASYDASVITECIIDIPNTVLAQITDSIDVADDSRKCEEYAGTLIGYSQNTPTLTTTFAKSVRVANQPQGPSGLHPLIATVKDGSGNENITAETGKFTVITDGSIVLDNANIKNKVSDGIWVKDKDSFPILSSFVLVNLAVSGAKQEYYYGEEFNPNGMKVTLETGNYNEEPKTIKIYKLDTSKYLRNNVSTIECPIVVSIGSLNATIKASVNKCDIVRLEAKDNYNTENEDEFLWAGEKYSTAGRDVTVTATLSNGQKIDLLSTTQLSYVNYLEGKEVEIYAEAEKLQAGKNKIIVKYGGLKAYFLVDAQEDELVLLEIVELPDKTTYTVGDTFSTDGLVVTAGYKSGKTITSVNHSDLEIIGGEISEGQNKIIVSYDAYRIALTKEGEGITVLGVPNELTITTPPSNTTFYVGDKIDLSGMTLKYKSLDTEEEISVADCTVTPNVLTTAGEHEVTVSYKNSSVTVKVSATEKPPFVNKLEIVSQPSRTEYYVGEAIDLSGMLLKYTTESGEKIVPPSECIVSHTTLPTAGNHTVIVVYENLTITITLTAVEKTTGNDGTSPKPKINVADIDGDGQVTYADAVALLKFIHFANVYSINAGTGDANGDGKITTDDAIYIKNHVFNPSEYPIVG